MLRRMRDFSDYSIQAADGVLGLVKDFYFDDDAWVVRYIVVEVDPGEPNRQVLISPLSIGHPNWEAATFPTLLTRKQINESPAIDTGKPFSRQPNEAAHLRSAKEVRTYEVHGSDGEVGRVKGFVVDESTWAIGYLIVNTSKWWLGHEVLVDPGSIEQVDWLQRTVTVDMSRDAIRHSAPYDVRMLMQQGAAP